MMDGINTEWKVLWPRLQMIPYRAINSRVSCRTKEPNRLHPAAHVHIKLIHSLRLCIPFWFKWYSHLSCCCDCNVLEDNKFICSEFLSSPWVTFKRQDTTWKAAMSPTNGSSWLATSWIYPNLFPTWTDKVKICVYVAKTLNWICYCCLGYSTLQMRF